MARFLKVHHYSNEKGWIINLESITIIDEKNRLVNLADGDNFHFVRNDEWEKLMSFVKANQV